MPLILIRLKISRYFKYICCEMRGCIIKLKQQLLVFSVNMEQYE